MKKLKSLMLVALIGMSALGTQSCNSEEVYEEPVAQEDTSNEDADVAVTDVNAPCDFSLADLEPNSTVVINCILDLQGETFNLPDNVTLLAEGGDIINGTLHFSEGSSIDGDLLGSTLSVSGSNPALRDTSFSFDPTRWGIVEGVVSDEVAQKNTEILENTMELAKKYGIDTFKIDEMDAYFKTDNPLVHVAEAALNVPGDFNLVMTNSTHIRVQPNDYKNTTLLALFKVNNVTITGGFLHGDRDEHDYSDTSTGHEWGHCLRITGSKNILVQEMTMMDAGGDAVNINAYGHAFGSDYVYSENVAISNNTLLRSRRNNVSITDGRNLLIEGNDIIEGGISTEKSRGVLPGWGIDLEGVRSGGLLYEIVKDVVIRDNYETGSQNGSIIIFTADDVIIEGNTLETGLSFVHTEGSIIRNNKITAVREISKTNGTGIGSDMKSEDANHSNQVYGNEVIDFGIGISVVGRNHTVFDNVVTNCTNGIVLKTLKDCRFYGNVVKSNVKASIGFSNSSDYLDNVIIGADIDEANTNANQNVIDVLGNGLRLEYINDDKGQEDFKVVVKNNSITCLSTTNFFFSNGLEIADNTFTDNGTFLYGMENIKVYNNEFSRLKLGKGLVNVDFSENIIGSGCISIPNDALNISNEKNSCN